MKKWLMAVVFGSVLVLGACGGDTDTDDTPEPADTEEEATDDATDDAADEGGSVDAAAAEELYKQSCASCHGENLEGGAFPELANIGSKLDANEIEEIINEGAGSMPAGLLQGEDATIVAEWLAEQK